MPGVHPPFPGDQAERDDDSASRETAVVLVADPDPSQAELLRARWEGTRTRVLWCADGAQALFLAGRHRPDLVVLTITRTGISAAEVTRILREHSNAPVLLALGEGDTTWATEILGRALLTGANEIIATSYATGPAFDKLHAVVSKIDQTRDTPADLSLGNLTLLPGRLEVRLGQRIITPTVREFEILQYLVENQHRTVAAEEVIAAVWGQQSATPKTLSVHLHRLRKALAPEIEIPHVRGAGYRLTLATNDDAIPGDHI